MKPTTMKDIIADRIRTDIMRGTLKLGQQIPEKQYAEMFDVSRTPVREAILSLASHGLIRVRAQSSSRVLSFTQESLRELFDARAFFEIGALRAASAEARSDLLATLRALYAEMERHAGGADGYEQFCALDTEFHARFVAATGNDLILRAYEPIQVALQAARSRLPQQPETAARAQQDHASLIEALAASDLDAAEAALRTHYAWVLADLLTNEEIVAPT